MLTNRSNPCGHEQGDQRVEDVAQAKRAARGFRTSANFIAIAYLSCSAFSTATSAGFERKASLSRICVTP